MLQVREMGAGYDRIPVLFDVSIEMKEGEMVCLLGRNGAGKTTTLHAISGLLMPSSGVIAFRGQDITTWPSHKRARLGIGLVPQGRRIFPEMTVKENLQVAERNDTRGGEGWNLQRVFDLFPALKPMERRTGRSLSGGEQQMLSIARALMGNPDLLLLDEPSEGLAPQILRSLGEQILRLKQRGYSMLLAEQNVRWAARLADRCYVLEKGVVCFSGSTQELMEREDILQTYLGISATSPLYQREG